MSLLSVLSMIALAQSSLGGLVGRDGGGIGIGGIGSLGQGQIAKPMPSTSTVLPDGGLTAFAGELAKLAGPEWRVWELGETVGLNVTVMTMPMNAAFATDVQPSDYTLTVTVSRYVDDARQRAMAATALKRERAAWKTVEKLECDGMEFNDHYLDGLCFRTKTEAQDRRVATYRELRERLKAVPRFHRGSDFSVALTWKKPELTAGSCDFCDTLEKKVEAVLTAYPSK